MVIIDYTTIILLIVYIVGLSARFSHGHCRDDCMGIVTFEAGEETKRYEYAVL